MTSPLLTVDQVAELVQLDPETVRRAIRRGELVAARIGGRLRIRPEQVDAWVDAQVVEPSRASRQVRQPLPPAPVGTSVRDRMRSKSQPHAA